MSSSPRHRLQYFNRRTLIEMLIFVVPLAAPQETPREALHEILAGGESGR